MVVYVCVGLPACHELGHHVFFHDMLVCRFCTLSNLCILFLFAAVILLLRVVLMKLLLLPHGLLLHFFFHHDFSPGAQLSG